MLRLLTLSLILNPLLAQAKWEDMTTMLNLILDPAKYDPRIRPVPWDKGPTNVTINIYLRGIDHVCTARMQWKPQLTFRQQWNDPRLKFNDHRGTIRYLTLTEPERIWTPDSFISNSLKTEIMSDLKPNVLIRISPNGDVLYSTRMNTQLSCPMDLRYYPFDKQICSISLASYGYTTDDIVFYWKEDTSPTSTVKEYGQKVFSNQRGSAASVPGQARPADPIQVTRNLNLPDFYLTKFLTGYCTSRTNTGEYSCLKVDFLFVRESSKYTFQWFLPSAVLTIISFASFWMKPNATRVKFLVATLLLVYLHILYINNKANVRVSYYTFKDCWNMTCIIFVVAAIAELLVVKVIHRLTTKTSHERTKDSDDMQKSLTSDTWISDTKTIVEKVKGLLVTQVVDLIAAILFPLVFVIYMVSYFNWESADQI